MDALERPALRNTFEGKAFRGHLRISNLKAKPFVDILEWPAFWSTGNILFEVLEGMPFVDNIEKPTCGYEALIFTKNVYSHRQPNKLIKTIKNHCPRLCCRAPKRVQGLQSDP